MEVIRPVTKRLAAVAGILSVALSSAHAQASPEAALSGLLKAFSRADVVGASRFVWGAAEPSRLQAIARAMSRGTPFVVTASSVRSAVHGDRAVVSFRLSGNLRSDKVEALGTETVSAAKRSGQWRLVAPSRQPAENRGHFVDGIVSMLVDPEASGIAAYGQQQAVECMSHVKQLCTGIAIFLADSGDRFSLSSRGFETSLMPYVKDKTVFSCAATGARYQFNNALSGKKVESIKHPARTVMVYEGSNGKLDFRHNGKAVVGFADCESRLIGREEAKRLIWKP